MNELSFSVSDDYELIKKALWNKNGFGCEDCFLSLYVWKNNYKTKVFNSADGIVFYISKRDSYLFPLPIESAVSTIKNLVNDRKQITLMRITDDQKQILEKAYTGCLEAKEDEGAFDYIYTIKSLAELSGSKLSKKRNHINVFLKTYTDWTIEEITIENISEVLAFAEKWYEKKTGGDSEIGAESLEQEKIALFNIMPKLKQFGADGILLRVNGKIEAFTVGQRISETVYDVVFEKGNDEVHGSYNMINREFARYLQKKYPGLEYINRENDLNLPGLRKAKLSYMPAFLLKKYICVIKASN